LENSQLLENQQELINHLEHFHLLVIVVVELYVVEEEVHHLVVVQGLFENLLVEDLLLLVLVGFVDLVVLDLNLLVIMWKDEEQLEEALLHLELVARNFVVSLLVFVVREV